MGQKRLRTTVLYLMTVLVFLKFFFILLSGFFKVF